jgi:hypothetical protein
MEKSNYLYEFDICEILKNSDLFNVRGKIMQKITNLQNPNFDKYLIFVTLSKLKGFLNNESKEIKINIDKNVIDENITKENYNSNNSYDIQLRTLISKKILIIKDANYLKYILLILTKLEVYFNYLYSFNEFEINIYNIIPSEEQECNIQKQIYLMEKILILLQIIKKIKKYNDNIINYFESLIKEIKDIYEKPQTIIGDDVKYYEKISNKLDEIYKNEENEIQETIIPVDFYTKRQGGRVKKFKKRKTFIKKNIYKRKKNKTNKKEKK